MQYLKEELDIKGGIKKFKNWFKFRDTHNICKKYGIENYHINDDGTVDVNGDVNLMSKGLDKIPLNFGYVSGWFSCRENDLKNLIGSPKRVGGFFSCGNNLLTSLEGCPTYIEGHFYCENNKNLWSMDHFPRHTKGVTLFATPIEPIFNLFRFFYLLEGGKFFSTSGTMMDFFWDCDPVYPGGIIKKRRMNNFLSSIGKELTPDDIWTLKMSRWKIED